MSIKTVAAFVAAMAPGCVHLSDVEYLRPPAVAAASPSSSAKDTAESIAADLAMLEAECANNVAACQAKNFTVRNHVGEKTVDVDGTMVRPNNSRFMVGVVALDRTSEPPTTRISNLNGELTTVAANCVPGQKNGDGLVNQICSFVARAQALARRINTGN